MILFNCSKCGEQLEAPQSIAGQTLKCPRCGLHEIVPTPSIVKGTVEKSKKATNTFLIKVWENTPKPFKNAFLATVGVVAAVLLSYFVYANVFASEPSNIEKNTSLLAKHKLFPLGSETVIFRGRQLLRYKFAPDANNPTTNLSLFYDSNNTLVGVSAWWNGTVGGLPADLATDKQAYYINKAVCDGFKKIVGLYMVFSPDDFFFTSGDTGPKHFNKRKGKWAIQINRYETEFVGSELHRDLAGTLRNNKDYGVYQFIATAQSW